MSNGRTNSALDALREDIGRLERPYDLMYIRTLLHLIRIRKIKDYSSVSIQLLSLLAECMGKAYEELVVCNLPGVAPVIPPNIYNVAGNFNLFSDSEIREMQNFLRNSLWSKAKTPILEKVITEKLDIECFPLFSTEFVTSDETRIRSVQLAIEASHHREAFEFFLPGGMIDVDVEGVLWKHLNSLGYFMERNAVSGAIQAQKVNEMLVVTITDNGTVIRVSVQEEPGLAKLAAQV